MSKFIAMYWLQMQRLALAYARFNGDPFQSPRNNKL